MGAGDDGSRPTARVLQYSTLDEYQPMTTTVNTVQPPAIGWERHLWPWLLLLIVGVLAATLRYGVIEPSATAQLCESGHGPVWCPARQWLVQRFLNNTFGFAALVAAALALVVKQRWTAWLAAALGIFALELYCFEAGALALLIGCLRLLRIQAQILARSIPAR